MSAAVHQHPRAVELVARRKLRRQVERAVERLLAVLDELDGDTEAEPWLGTAVVLYPVYNDQRFWAEGANDDREQDADDRELEDEHGAADDAGEPSLGAAENREDQRRWAAGGRQDLADDEVTA